MSVTVFSAIIILDSNTGVYHGYKTVFEKCYCCDSLGFMFLVVVQGAQAQQTGLDYQSLHLLPLMAISS